MRTLDRFMLVGVLTVLAVGVLFASSRIVSVAHDADAIRSVTDQAREGVAAAQRNGAVSACLSTYSATYDGWIAEFTRTASDPDLRQTASENAVEMVRRRLGVAELSRENTDDPFVCPELPPRLVIDPLIP